MKKRQLGESDKNYEKKNKIKKECRALNHVLTLVTNNKNLCTLKDAIHIMLVSKECFSVIVKIGALNFASLSELTKFLSCSLDRMTSKISNSLHVLSWQDAWILNTAYCECVIQIPEITKKNSQSTEIIKITLQFYCQDGYLKLHGHSRNRTLDKIVSLEGNKLYERVLIKKSPTIYFTDLTCKITKSYESEIDCWLLNIIQELASKIIRRV